MSDDSGVDEPTRRDYLKYGGTVAVGGLLAGCTGNSDEESTSTATATDTTTQTAEPTATEESSYSVTM